MGRLRIALVAFAATLAGCGGSAPEHLTRHLTRQQQITAQTGLRCGASVATACPASDAPSNVTSPARGPTAKYFQFCSDLALTNFIPHSQFTPSGPLIQGYGEQSCTGNASSMNRLVGPQGSFVNLYMLWLDGHFHLMAFSHVKCANRTPPEGVTGCDTNAGPGGTVLSEEADSHQCVTFEQRKWHALVRGWFYLKVDNGQAVPFDNTFGLVIVFAYQRNSSDTWRDCKVAQPKTDPG